MSEMKMIKPSFQLFDSHMKPVDKVATMARLCYRSEKVATPETDAALVKGCIMRGHTSVTEHGFMAVYLSPDKMDPKIFGREEAQPFSSQMLWDQYHSPDKNKYTEMFGDDLIYKKIDGDNAQAKIYPTIVADFRAWLNILDDLLAASIQNRWDIGVAFIIGIMVKANHEFPTIFCQLIEKVNTALATARRDHFLCKTFLPEDAPEDRKLTAEDFSKYYDQMGITVSAASPRYTLSVIMTTNRAVTHEVVRHRRDVAYSQESQRFVNYGGKGYEFIWPASDLRRTGRANTLLESTDGSFVSVEEGGFWPENTKAFAVVKKSCEDDMKSYEELRALEIRHEGEVTESDPKQETIPPEDARIVLGNHFATRLGITWTPATFTNVMRWRLDQHAWWPFRSMMGNIMIECLRSGHMFFENFPPSLIKHWLEEVKKNNIFTDEAILKELNEAQDKRQKNIDEAQRKLNEAMMKRMEEMRKQQEEEAKAKAEAEQKPDAEAPKTEGQPACTIAPTAEKKD